MRYLLISLFCACSVFFALQSELHWFSHSEINLESMDHYARCHSVRPAMIPYADIKFQMRHELLFQDKNWYQGNKFKVNWNGQKFVLKTETPHFEIVYHLISRVLNLAHSKYLIYASRVAPSSHFVLIPWYENVQHGWHVYKFCLNISDRNVFDMLFNDFLMGYSDRSPNCHLKNATVIPIDQDSGAYSALLPPQTDSVYEKHILHNMMIRRDRALCAAFQRHHPCSSFVFNNTLRQCLGEWLSTFPLHSTKLEHIMYRYNEANLYSCQCTSH